ncbi:hypothetical protein Aple_010430 [Acrocarpospora pleiomorpha]|uniref:Uncharacterized protein n=1 Tax=Acrocarpospora pleiomorpha TaxID=90975 RepID=A0A5M3XJA5_9ACTN|nr:hypothetical protein [Acrocarpospora pleiomorpha]GES18148.1 hypothetical protein Aple_010430 [Acrocarpospora pleiomorpha]
MTTPQSRKRARAARETLATAPAEPPARSLPVELRVVGTHAELDQVIARVGEAFSIATTSRRFPRREEPGRVSVHLTLDPL